MGSSQVNQYLKERRKKLKTTAKFRKKRIYHHFQKQKQQHFNDLQKKGEQIENHERRTSFYNQYFTNTGEVKEEMKKQKRQQPVSKGKQDKRIQKLKGRKKKFIKKMMKEKNNRGQPKLKNYVQYAVTKLQQTIEKEKKHKKNKLARQ